MVVMPIARAVRMIRRAISPRLATSSEVMGRTRTLLLSLSLLLTLLLLLTSGFMTASHPEDAVAPGARGRLVVDDREAEPEHRAGITRVDDAVVVET